MVTHISTKRILGNDGQNCKNMSYLISIIFNVSQVEIAAVQA